MGQQDADLWLRTFQQWVAFTLIAVPPIAHATSTTPSIPAAWSQCFRLAGQYYRLPPTLLIAVARTESQLNPAAVNVNRDGSRDVGLMQINSRWWPALQVIGIRPERLYEPCVSIWVGAWLLADVVAVHGYNWDAVGVYNAGDRHTPAAAERRASYARRVALNLAGQPAAVGLLDTGRVERSHIAEFVVTAAPWDDASGDSLHSR